MLTEHTDCALDRVYARLAPCIAYVVPFILATLAILIAALSSGPVSAQPPAGYVAKVTSVVVYAMDDSAFAALTADQRQKLEQQGIKVLDDQKALQSPELPLAGYWFLIEGKRYISDKDGYVRVAELPTTITQIQVFAHFKDSAPIGTLDRIQFKPTGQVPPASVLKLTYTPPTHMNKHETAQPNADAGGCHAPLANCPTSISAFVEGAGALPPACAKRKACAAVGSAGANTAACCLDYNGPFGDGVAYFRTGAADCVTQAVTNFAMSTCFTWTMLKRGRPCLAERAILQVEGPNCWNNHKYRNCQNMDETDFKLTPPSTTISYGKTANLKVHNNTAGNFSCLALTTNPRKAGSLVKGWKSTTFSKSADCGGEYKLNHFNDTAKKHYVEAPVIFKAPKTAPAGVCQEEFTVTSLSGEQSGLSQDVKITVKKPSCGCWAFSNVQGWNARITFNYSGGGSKTDPDGTGETVTYSHKADYTTSLGSRLGGNANVPGDVSWNGTDLTGTVIVTDETNATDKYQDGGFFSWRWTSNGSGPPSEQNTRLIIDPATCIFRIETGVSTLVKVIQANSETNDSTGAGSFVVEGSLPTSSPNLVISGSKSLPMRDEPDVVNVFEAGSTYEVQQANWFNGGENKLPNAQVTWNLTPVPAPH